MWESKEKQQPWGNILDCNVTLIPYQHVVTMVKLTSGPINGTAICKITKVIFLFYSIVARAWWSGYVLPRTSGKICVS